MLLRKESWCLAFIRFQRVMDPWKIKKHCVVGRVWEVLESVRKREVLSLKSEKVTFQKAQSLSKKNNKTNHNKQT